MDKNKVIDKLWENSGHGTRRIDIEVAFEAGVIAEQKQRTAPGGDVKSYGQLAYEGYCSGGRRIPEPWELKDEFERLMWEACGVAVARACAEACEELNAFDYDDPAASFAAAIRKRFSSQ